MTNHTKTAANVLIKRKDINNPIRTPLNYPSGVDNHIIIKVNVIIGKAIIMLKTAYNLQYTERRVV
jgi:hypothetical protein